MRSFISGVLSTLVVLLLINYGREEPLVAVLLGVICLLVAALIWVAVQLDGMFGR